MTADQATVYLIIMGGILFVGIVAGVVSTLMARSTSKRAFDLWERFVAQQNFENAVSFIRLHLENRQDFVQDDLAVLLRDWPDLTPDQRRKLRRMLQVATKGDVHVSALFDGVEDYLEADFQAIEWIIAEFRNLLRLPHAPSPTTIDKLDMHITDLRNLGDEVEEILQKNQIRRILGERIIEHSMTGPSNVQPDEVREQVECAIRDLEELIERKRNQSEDKGHRFPE